MRFFRGLALLFGVGLLFFGWLINSDIASAHNDPNGRSGSPNSVFVIEISDEIKAGTALEIERAVQRANDEQASHLIIMLDTPGGLLQSTRTIVDSLSESTAETVVYVHKSGGWAYSAGTIILLAADHAYMHPAASIGAAQPFSPAGENEISDKKALEATATWVRSLAERNNRDPNLAERFVRENLTLTGEAAAKQNIIDATADNLDAVLAELDATNAQVTTLEPSLLAKVLNVVSHPYLISLFLALGGLALILAVRSGEFAVSSAIGVVLLLIGLWGIGVIEFSFLGIGLLLLGVILIMIELFDQPGFGIFGVSGIVALVLGIYSLSEEPFFDPAVFSPISIIVMGTLAMSLVLLAIVSRALAKTFKSSPVSGAESLIGKEAMAVTALNPRGRVTVNGENWQAELVSGKNAPKGAKTYITDSKGNTLYVRLKNVKRRSK